MTGDGPAHLYNSNIVLQLLSEAPGPIASFFELRTELIPNIGGHAILTFLNLLFDARTAEKIVYSLALVLLPLGIRYLLKAVSPYAVLWVYLAIPLVHNFCFYIGFQSFCLGLGLLFFSIGYYVRIQQSSSIRQYAWLAIIIFVTTLFHLFASAIALMAIGILLIIDILSSKRFRVSNLAFLTIALLPSLVLGALFLLKNTGEFQLNNAPLSDLWTGIIKARPLVTIDTIETKYSVPYNLLLLSGIILGLIFRFGQRRAFGIRDFAWVTSLFLLILYFILPDKMASGSFVTVRLLLGAFVFMALSVSLFLKPHLLSYLLMAGSIFLNVKLINYHYRKAKELSADALAINIASDYIPPQSTVVPLNYSYHWLHYNIGLYPGSEKPLIILDNYEASTAHFPVMWKPESFPDDLLGDFGYSKRPELKISPYEDYSGHRVDAVIRWMYEPEITDSITLITNKLLDDEFYRVYLSKDQEVEVHLRK